jgi:hypothetical protein
MGQSTYMWILCVRFAVGLDTDDRGIIEAIIDTPQYGYDFASPFDGVGARTDPDIHERWWRKNITPDRFKARTPEEAAEVIRAWAEDQDWTDPDFTPTPEAQRRLQETYSLIGTGHVFELENPPTECEQDYGWVMGKLGFHEFVVIDRVHRVVSLVVACDD